MLLRLDEARGWGADAFVHGLADTPRLGQMTHNFILLW